MKGIKMVTTERLIKTEWCVPNMYTESTDEFGRPKPFSGFVAQKANIGWIILCEIWQDCNTGETYRRPIKSADIKTVEL